MLHILYLLFIAPLEFLMRLVLEWGFSWTHSWGWSLVLLSLAVNTVILPIYNKAEGWQEDERKLKRGMERHEAMLRRTFKGQKLFFLLSVLRRQFGYTHFLSLRASVGLLLQIPFFFAAYHLLSHFTPLNGQSFGILPDLGTPDALLAWGSLRVNLLPITMTAVNLASAFVYTRTLTRRDRMQIYGMAALFLVLLYNSPAALTFYWTLNNIYSLGKNLVEKGEIWTRFRQGGQTRMRDALFALVRQKGRVGDATRAAVMLSREFGRFVNAAGYGFGIGAIFWLVTCGAVLATHNGEFDAAVKTALAHFTGQCILTALLASVVLYFCVLRQPLQQLANHPLILSASIAALFLLQLKLFKWGFKISNNRVLFDMWNAKGIICFLLFSLCIFSTQHYWNILKKYLYRYKQKQLKVVVEYSQYIYSHIFICLMIIYISFSIYDADTSLYTSTIDHIVISILSYCLSMLILFNLLWIILPSKIRHIVSFILIYIVFSSFINYLFFTPDLGIFEGTIFQNDSFFKKRITLGYDLFLQIFIPIALSFLVIHFKRLYNIYIIFLIISSISLFILSCYKIVPYILETKENISYEGKINSYSKTKENVIVLIFDMFTGGHIEKMINDPWFDDFVNQMDGFSWYPDTISAGSATIHSLPSIYGGFGYTPQSINKNKYNLVEYINKSYAMMPRNFANSGYNVLMARNFMEFDNNIYNSYTENNEKISTIVDMHKKVTHNVTSFFANLSFFEMSPDILRIIIYNGGTWHGLLKNHITNAIDMYEHEYNFLNYILNNSISTDSSYPTFKMHYSMFSHISWYIAPDFKNYKPIFVQDPYPETKGELILKDGILPEHYFAERHIMHLVIKFIEHLKHAGIYDNTRIILVSDHGEADSQMVARSYNDGQLPPDGCDWRKRRTECQYGAYPPGRPHALLMVKEPNQRGPLRIKNAFMSSADVPALAMKGLKACDEFELYDPEALPPPRILTHATGSFQLKNHNKDSYNCQFYRFEGTLFDPSKVSEVQINQIE